MWGFVRGVVIVLDGILFVVMLDVTRWALAGVGLIAPTEHWQAIRALLGMAGCPQ